MILTAEWNRTRERPKEIKITKGEKNGKYKYNKQQAEMVKSKGE